MALEGKGKLQEPVKGRITLYIPAHVHRDSAFPFKPKEDVIVRIDGNRLVIEKAKE